MSSAAAFQLARLAGFLIILGFTAVVIDVVEGRRYRYCSEGCCIHEYCAYHKICYPKVHCHLGCPDGTCEQGVCMPTTPCNDTTICSMGHACQHNYNLGYRTCQYNLNMGSSLCVDRDGRPVLKFT